MHGITHAATSSTGGVAFECSIREKSYRGPSEMKPMGSPSRYATSPAEFFRRRASLARAARRFPSAVPGPPPLMPSLRCSAAL